MHAPKGPTQEPYQGFAKGLYTFSLPADCLPEKRTKQAASGTW